MNLLEHYYTNIKVLDRGVWCFEGCPPTEWVEIEADISCYGLKEHKIEKLSKQQYEKLLKQGYLMG